MGGKSKAPPAPDYTAAAQATAAGNIDAARVAAAANRVNQVTPYGNLTYTRNTTFDQAGYDKALQAYNQQMANSPTRSGFGGLLGGIGAPKAPNASDFMNPDNWTATQTLSPDQQYLLDKQNKTSMGLADTMDQGLGYVQQMMNNPFDQSALPKSMVNQGQTMQDAIMSRLQPQIDRERGGLESQLANQGITRGSEAWNNAMTSQNQRENDLMSQAAMSGINAGNAQRQQAIQEQAFFRNEPINTLNAVRTGAQVQGPNFVNSAQQATTQGPDLLGATQNQYNAAVGNVNSQNAQKANTTAGIASAAAMAAMMF